MQKSVAPSPPIRKLFSSITRARGRARYYARCCARRRSRGRLVSLFAVLAVLAVLDGLCVPGPRCSSGLLRYGSRCMPVFSPGVLGARVACRCPCAACAVQLSKIMDPWVSPGWILDESRCFVLCRSILYVLLPVPLIPFHLPLYSIGLLYVLRKATEPIMVAHK